MAAVTYTTKCSDGSSVTFEGTLSFPAGKPVYNIGGECYTVTGYGDESSATPTPQLGSEQFKTCDVCEVNLNNGYYTLTNCEDPIDQIFTLTPGIESYVGQVIKLDGKCYTVSGSSAAGFKDEWSLEEVDLSSPDLYANCEECFNKYVKATRCDTGNVIYLPNATRPSGTQGLIFKLSDGNCYALENISTGQTLSTESFTLVEGFGLSNSACDSCKTANFFRLENCDDSDNVIFVAESEGTLVSGTHNDKIIRVNINGTNQCFQVLLQNLPLTTPDQIFPGALLSVHDNCTDCLSQGILEIPSDLEGATLFTLTEDGDDCDRLKITNLTQLYDETLYSELALPVLEITTPDGFKLIFDTSTIPVTDASFEQPFDPLNPTSPIIISIGDLEENSDFGVIQTVGGSPQELEELPWTKYPDGIYEIKWKFQTIGDTTGLYETTEKKIWLCGAKGCYVSLADKYLNKECIDCDDKDNANVNTLMELRVLISAAQFNFDKGNFECANTVLKAISKICSDEDCGCQQ